MKQRILSKKEWDYIVCPDKIAEMVLTSAGYDFRGCKIYLGSKAISPYSMQKENVLTWTTVGDFLKDKGLIDFEEDWQCVKAIKEYYMKLNEAEKVLNDAGFLMEARLATFDGVVREIKKLLKSKYEITDRSKFNQYVEELTPVRVPQVYTSAEYARKLCKDYFGW
jgi:hypothetical protein